MVRVLPGLTRAPKRTCEPRLFCVAEALLRTSGFDIGANLHLARPAHPGVGWSVDRAGLGRLASSCADWGLASVCGGCNHKGARW